MFNRIFYFFMGLKLSRKTKKIREFILNLIRKRSFNSFKIIICFFSMIKFINKKLKRKSYIKFSENLDDINKYEFRKTSQNNEDGIIKFIFNKIRLKKINFVEIGFDFYQNNSLNFLHKTNKGLFIDGSEEKAIKLKSITRLLYPTKNISVVQKFIDIENLNLIIENYFHKHESIDFLSIDVDGNDYYLFQKLNIKPKIICIEYNYRFGRDIKCSIPYDKNFNWETGSPYFGTSLNALCALAQRKGYYLVALESSCVNAFFIRSDFKDKFQIIDNIKSFRTPRSSSDSEIANAKKYLLSKKLNILK